MLLKHEGFKEEKEFRFYAFTYPKSVASSPAFVEGKEKKFKEIKGRNVGGTIVPFVELFEKCGRLPIEKIIVGPHKDKNRRCDSLKIYLHSLGLSHIQVSVSGIPYAHRY